MSGMDWVMGLDMLAMPAMPRGEVGDFGGGEVPWFWSLLVVAMVVLVLVLVLRGTAGCGAEPLVGTEPEDAVL